MTAMLSVCWKLSLMKCFSVNRLVFFSMSDENIRVKNSLQEKEYKVSVVVLPSLKIFKI